MKKQDIPESVKAKNPPVIVFPLFGQVKQKGLNEEEMAAELKKQRNLIRQNSGNRGVRAMFNMVERMAARLQGDGVEADADKHAQGMACGAGYVYKVLRAVLEGTEEEEEEEEGDGEE